MAHLVGSVFRAESQHMVVDNEPYALDQSRDFTVPEHGERRGIPSLEIEIRQDLIETPEGQTAWADLLAPAFQRSAEHLLRDLG
jgi:predicted N-formylglutamate amidohydrolase